MSVRQYERVDCTTWAQQGQTLEIACASIVANGTGECDAVMIFGNPETRDRVWVSYNSRVEIEGKKYKVLRGKLRDYRGDRLWTHDQSIACLLSEDGSLHSLLEVEHKEATVTEVYDSKIRAFLQYLFDWWHKKLEPVNTHSFEQLARYGIRPPKSYWNK